MQKFASSAVSRTDALEILKKRLPATAPRVIPVIDANGLTASETVVSQIDLPRYTCSAMDGYALISADTVKADVLSPIELENKGEIRPSGGEAGPVLSGQTCRILTGGVLPEGADSVIPFEKVQVSGDRIKIFHSVEKHSFTYRPGSDLQKGALIISSGEKITPEHCSLLTYADVREIKAHPLPRILILSIGNELCDPLDPIKEGFIPADNLILLKNLCSEFDFNDVEISVCPNEIEVISERIISSRDRDLIITTGGTGPGRRDFTRAGIEHAGGSELFNGIMLRPGKSVFSYLSKNTPVIGLPGPPYAVQACFHLLIRPVLSYLSGQQDYQPSIIGKLETEIEGSVNSERTILCNIKYTENGIVAVPLNNKSSLRQSMCNANGMILIPKGVKKLSKNCTVNILPFRMPL